MSAKVSKERGPTQVRFGKPGKAIALQHRPCPLGADVAFDTAAGKESTREEK
jgi:hypothetical protein